MEIADVARELKYPGARALYAALRQRGITVPRADVDDFLKGRSERQVRSGVRFNRKLRGHITATGPRQKFYVDLMDLSQDPSGPWKYIMVAMDVYTKNLWARPTKTKLPHETAEVFEEILDLSRDPSAVYTDDGGEWTGPFEALLLEREIVHMRKTEASDRNFLAPLDAQIRQLRRILEEDMDREGTDKWEPLLKEAVEVMNKLPRPALFNASSAKVEKGDNFSLEFDLQAQTARRMQETSDRIEERRNVLEGAGAFRTPIRQAFRQGYRPRWSGEIHFFDKAELAQVTDTKGKRLLECGG